MVVKTEVCYFSEQKIYPGKGMRVITKDGRLVIFSSKKARCFHNRKVKGQIIRWTIVWRRLNKKLKTDEAAKRKKRRARRIIRDIQGLNREEIRRERGKTTEERDAQREQAIREIKERKAKFAQQKKTTAKAGPATAKVNAKNTKKH